ncbi:MAG: hypothetical protein FD168_1206 [Desulfobulbaceae bacterium]|nr:MAG: hypothetical protein FD168_1206 [Desulfobulbaceae bacterium]
MTSTNSIATPRLSVLQGYSTNINPNEAVQELAVQIRQPQSKICLVFFSDEYDKKKLGKALQEHLPGLVVGCTTAGQLSSVGFQCGGISGVSFASDELIAVPYLIHPLSSLVEQIGVIAADAQDKISRLKLPAFGLLLVDGLSTKEELLTAALYRVLGDVPIVGGSAGDMLKFQKTFVYHNGELLSDAAIFTLFLTSLPFHVFKHQHFLPSTTKLVVTEAEPNERLVKEINGEPAAEAYARLIGIPVDKLNGTVFSQNPLMLRIKDDYYVRSIASVEKNGFLKLYCAINAGLVLTIGKGYSIQEGLEKNLLQVKQQIGEPAVIIGCDCIYRRLEMEAQGIDKNIGQLLAQNKVVGFSTYGEQFNSIHVNQTFTGVAIGGQS